MAKRGCLFCRADGPYNTVEHPVPESLGNTDDVLEDAVCDTCQNFFGAKIEQPVLEKTQLGVWRAHLGIPTKAGAAPQADIRPPKSFGPFGKIPEDKRVGFTMKPGADSTVDVEFFPPEAAIFSNGGKKITLTVTINAWYLSILGRFLAKAALGTMALNNTDRAWDSRYDALRNYARHGSSKSLWPLYWKSTGRMDNLIRTYREGDRLVKEIVCYEAFFLEQDESTYCVFQMGPESYLLRMDSAEPKAELDFTIDAPLHPFTMLWFEDGAWSKADGPTPEPT